MQQEEQLLQTTPISNAIIDIFTSIITNIKYYVYYKSLVLLILYVLLLALVVVWALSDFSKKRSLIGNICSSGVLTFGAKWEGRAPGSL